MNAAFASVRALLRIELKRSIGLLLFPLLLLAAWYGASNSLPTGIYMWLDTSSAVRESVPFLGALAGGLSAWMAGRNHRRGVEDMLNVTPRSSIVRDLTAWAGTTFWVVAAYLLLAAVLSALTWQNATWGGPLPGYFIVGLLAMVAYSALGFAAGSWVPRRFTAPLLAIGIFIWEFALSSVSTKPDPELLSAAPVSLLSFNLDVFQKVPQVATQQSLWFLGLCGISLTATALKNARSNRLVWASLLGAVVVATVGLLTSLAAAAPLQGRASAKVTPFKPVCEKGKITVCVHPAYAKLLPEAARVVNQVAEPLESVPGVPTRFVQGSDVYRPPKGARSVTYFYLDSLKYGYEGMFKQDVAMNFVMNESVAAGGKSAPKPTEQDLKRCGGRVAGKDYFTIVLTTQTVVQEWLAGKARATYNNMYSTGDCPNEGKLEKRFANLDPAKRKAWLEKNFAALRAGKLTLKDLP